MTDIVGTVENTVRAAEPVIIAEVAKVEAVVAPVAVVVEAKVEEVAKTLSDLAVEAVKAAEKELALAKVKADVVKQNLEAELAKEADRIKAELAKIQTIAEVKKIEQAVVSTAEKVVAEETTAVKGHPVIATIVLLVIGAVVGAVGVLLFK